MEALKAAAAPEGREAKGLEEARSEAAPGGQCRAAAWLLCEVLDDAGHDGLVPAEALVVALVLGDDPLRPHASMAPGSKQKQRQQPPKGFSLPPSLPPLE